MLLESFALLQEIDSDWSSSHDGFKHKSFEHVIQAG